MRACRSLRTTGFLLRLATAAFAACALPSHATVLYKSIGPNGVIRFSDTPPEDGVVVEERFVDPSGGQPFAGAPDGMPLLAFENPLETAEHEGVDTDDALAAADQQVDLAEHALALARGSAWTRNEGLRLGNPRHAPGDAARIAFYERNLRAARANLLAAMKRAQTPLSPANTTPAMQLAQSQPAPPFHQ